MKHEQSHNTPKIRSPFVRTTESPLGQAKQLVISWGYPPMVSRQWKKIQNLFDFLSINSIESVSGPLSE